MDELTRLMLLQASLPPPDAAARTRLAVFWLPFVRKQMANEAAQARRAEFRVVDGEQGG